MTSYSALFRTIADYSSAIRETQRLGGEWRKAYTEGNKLGATGKSVGDQTEKGSARAAKAATSAGKAMTIGITLPLAAAATAAVHTYAEFETAIVSAGSKSNATADQLARMKKVALDVGNSTKFSAREAAQGLDVLAAAGLNANDAMAALPGVTNAAQAANEDLALTANVVAKSLNAFNLPAEKAGHVADVLAQAANTTALDMHGLQDALGQAGEVGARFGQKLEDVVAVTGRLVDMGVPAASAGVAVRQALTSLAAPTYKASVLLDQLGIETRDARGEMLPIPDLVRNVSKGLDQSNPSLKKFGALTKLSGKELKEWGRVHGMTAVQTEQLQAAVSKGGSAMQDYVTRTLFGVEGAKAFSLAMSQGKPVMIDVNKEVDQMSRLTEGLAQKMGKDGAEAFIRAHIEGDKFVATGADAVEVVSALAVASDGVAESIGLAFQQTTAQKVDNLQGSIETLAITVVDKLAPGLNDIIDKTTFWVTKLSDFADVHPNITKTAVAILGLTAAAGPALLITGQMITTWQKARPAVKAVSEAVTLAGWQLEEYGTKASLAGKQVRGGLLTSAGKFTAFLGGPWGIAISVAITLLAGYALKQKMAAEETKGFTDSLTFQNGALDSNSRQVLANKLAKDGLFDAAQKAGVSEVEYMRALMAGGAAREKMIHQLSQIAAEHTTVTNSGYGVAVSSDEVGKAAQQAADSLKTMGDSLDHSKVSSQQATTALKDQGSTTPGVTTATDKLTEAQKGLDKANQDLKTSVQAVVDQFTVLKDGALSSERAAIKYEEALDGVTSSAKENGKSLSRSTAAGRANRNAFLGAVEAINDKITADFKAKVTTDGVTKATKSAAKSLVTAETNLRKQAKAAGLSRTETDKMIKTYLKTPKQLRTDVKTPGVKEAQKNVDSFRKKVNDLKDRNIDVKTTFHSASVVAKWTAKNGQLSGDLRGRKDGGKISGPGTRRSDSILGIDKTSGVPTSWVSNEEFVTNAHQYAKNKSQVETINAGGEWDLIPRRADGGNVGPTTKRNVAAVFGTNPVPPGLAPKINGFINTFGSKMTGMFSRLLNKGWKAGVKQAQQQAREKDAAGGGPVSGGSYAKALSWARAQRGKPYIFGSAGPRGYDCSGFMGAIQNVIYGKKNPYFRRYSTTAFHGQHAQGFTRGKRSAFMVGVNPRPGRYGHMAGTLNGVHVESAGGVGVRIGGSARGANSGMFSWRGGLYRGGKVKPGVGGDLPFDLLDPHGQRFDPVLRELADAVYGGKGLEHGTRNARRGLYLTGEAGPELVRTKEGTQVNTNRQTLAYLSAIEDLAGRHHSLAGSPEPTYSRVPTTTPDQVIKQEFNMPIYYPRHDELPTAAAQKQLMRATADRTRRSEQSGSLAG